ncbi:MAG: alternative ribosome rescue aminoacyl-tRNA hydrolase ArfB [Myxococcota bacterium]
MSDGKQAELVVDHRVTIPAEDLSWTAERSSGPGGQHVNKVATKVLLRFDLEATRALSRAQKKRLRQFAGRRVAADGAILVRAQAERSQRRNLARARESLRQLVLRALHVPKRRVATKPSRAAKRRRVEAKRRRSETKRSRARVDKHADH